MAIFYGLVLGVGLILLAGAFKQQIRVDFAERIAPQMRAQVIKRTPVRRNFRNKSFDESVKELLRPLSNGIFQKFINQTDSEALRKRLIQSGKAISISDFRIEQVLWGFLAFISVSIILGLGVFQGKISLFPSLLVACLAAVTGFFARDWWLGQMIRKREKAMLAEFPALAELMALSVTAGESAVGALERVCKSSNGELSAEFQTILAQTRSGDGLLAALQNFSQRTDLSALARFVDGIVVAIERGTPLADVLRAQAQDVRDTAKRDLMETAGKKEIAMMAPIIFCILPLTVVFAIYPGLSLINLSF